MRSNQASPIGSRSLAWLALAGIAILADAYLLERMAFADEPSGSLKPVLDQATEAAKSPEGFDKSTAELKSLVATHLANDLVFKQALQQIAGQYKQAGRDDEGLRYFFDLGTRLDSKCPPALIEIVQEYQLRQPELVASLVGEYQKRSKRVPTLEVPPTSEVITRAILQRRDKELRDSALAKLRDQLASEMPGADKSAALSTLSDVLTAKFDRKPFRALVLPLLESNHERLRMQAVSCISSLDAQLEDLKAIARLADDPSPHVRRYVAGALVSIGDGRESAEVLPALLKLLTDPDPQVMEASLHSIWGQYSGPELDRRLIELSREPLYHGTAIYTGLSTQRQKSKLVCERLVEELNAPDWNNSSRAAWGLSFGVPDEAKPLVEAALLQALPEETNRNTRESEFRALAHVASETSRDYLTSIVDSPIETDAAQQAAREILDKLKQPE